jgi:hypothetical protein
MANEQDRKQDPAAETDISKAQSAQQPPEAEAGQQPETGEQGQQEFAQDQGGSPDEGLQGDTLAQQRTDIEGAARETPESGEAESGFVGSKGEKDTSSELVDEQDDEDAREGE